MRNIYLKKKNEKGMLLASETLKIIIAVICIIFLGYFLTSLYFSKTSAGKVSDAQNNLERVQQIIVGIQEGTTQTQDLPSPDGWHLYSFFKGSEMPNSCAGENCLCICDNVWFGSQAKKCDEKGSCIVVSNLGGPPIDMEITGANPLKFISIEKQNGVILVGEAK